MTGSLKRRGKCHANRIPSLKKTSKLLLGKETSIPSNQGFIFRPALYRQWVFIQAMGYQQGTGLELVPRHKAREIAKIARDFSQSSTLLVYLFPTRQVH